MDGVEGADVVIVKTYRGGFNSADVVSWERVLGTNNTFGLLIHLLQGPPAVVASTDAPTPAEVERILLGETERATAKIWTWAAPNKLLHARRMGDEVRFDMGPVGATGTVTVPFGYARELGLLLTRED